MTHQQATVLKAPAEAYSDLIAAAKRVSWKFGHDEAGVPSDWSEWADFREAIAAAEAQLQPTDSAPELIDRIVECLNTTPHDATTEQVLLDARAVLANVQPKAAEGAPLAAAEKWRRLSNPKTLEDYGLTITLAELEAFDEGRDVVSGIRAAQSHVQPKPAEAHELTDEQIADMIDEDGRGLACEFVSSAPVVGMDAAIKAIRTALASKAKPNGIQPCKGMNCGATDGKSHSPECFAEHAATVDPGVGERHREARYAGHNGEPFPRSASEDEQAAWMIGFKARLPAATQAPAPAQGEPVAWFTGPIEWAPRQSEQVRKFTRKAQPEHGFTFPVYGSTQSPAVAHGWQPIETAPRDQTWVLAWRSHATRPCIVRFDPAYGAYENEAGEHVYHLTRWQPLPAAPDSNVPVQPMGEQS